jgi:hypothetical protein
MSQQMRTIVWTPMNEQEPPPELVLASTKTDVYIVQLRKGPKHLKDSDSWMNKLGQKEDAIRFDDVIAWAKLPAPYDPDQTPG